MAAHLQSADLLKRFPGPLTLYPSRRKWLLMFVGSAAFAVGGAWMIRGGDSWGWFPLLFFGACALVGLVAVLPHAGALVLDRDGFEVTNLFRHHRSRWQDVSAFEAQSIPPAHQFFVVYDDASVSASSLAKINTAIVGRNAALPDTYGQRAEDLAQLLEQWRTLALRR
jgi:hypothetical protein